jgi:hypothetical protein
MGGAAAGARTAVRERAMLNNVLHRKPPCGLGTTLGWSQGAEDRRRGELYGGGPAAGRRFAPAAPMVDGEAQWRVCVRARSGRGGFL